MNFYALVLGAAALLIKIYDEHYRRIDLDKALDDLEGDASLPNIKTYDFIVGGGAAGCVISSRLSEKFNVLLLEAGGTPVPETETLVTYEEVLSNEIINYQYKIVPQTQASLENGGKLVARPGKMLGGSSSHHRYLWNRGNPLDYDHWANLTNDPSWKYENVLKYFKKSEEFRPAARKCFQVGKFCKENILNLFVHRESQHGDRGPIHLEDSDNPTIPTWVKAGQELGIDIYPDANGPQMEGISSTMQISRKDGRRVSPYTAYIRPYEGSRRKTLRIERYSEVLKVLIDDTKKAYGVMYLRHGIPQIAHASKEIIISAGSFGSPLILMKSGIGHANVLKKAEIPVIMDLPVGEEFREHPKVYPMVYTIKDNTILENIEKNVTEETLSEFHEKGTGVLAGGGIGGQAFIASSRAKSNNQENWPDMHIFFDERLPGVPLGDLSKFGVYIFLTRPKSVGYLTLDTAAYKSQSDGGTRSTDEKIAIADFKLLSDPSDVEVLLEGIKLALAMIEKTSAFQQYGVNPLDTKHSGCSDFKFRSDDYWRCYIRQTASGGDHIFSTCKMGSGSADTTAVVDSKLNVIGITGLKVVDGSIVPTFTNANPTAPIVMIAEKTSDEIMKTWRNS